MARPKPKQPKPDPPPANSGLKTLAEIVQLTGVSAGQIGEAAKRGFIASSGRGRYPIGPTLVGLLKFKNARDSHLPTYDNAAQCSAATGIPISVIKQARRRIQLGHGGSIALGPLLKSIFESNSENYSEMKTKYAALEEKRLHDEKMGRLVPKSEMEHAAKRGVGVVFRLLDQRSNVDLPPALVGLDAAGIQRELVKSDDELKANLVAEWSVLMRNGEGKNGDGK